MIAHRIKTNFISESDRLKKNSYQLIGLALSWGNALGGLAFCLYAWLIRDASAFSSYIIPAAMLVTGMLSIAVYHSSLGGRVKKRFYALNYAALPLLFYYFSDTAAVTVWGIVFLYLTFALVLQSRFLVTNAFIASLAGLLLIWFTSPAETAVSIGLEDHVIRLVLLATAVALVYWGLHALRNRENLLIHYMNLADNVAYLDPLLKMPNRQDFNLYVDHSLKSGNLMLAKIEINHFQSVYDLLGHDKSDKLLYLVKERIEKELADVAYIAKSEGGVFLAAITGIPEAEARKALENLLQHVAGSYSLGSLDYVLTLNIGVACSKKDGRTSDELMRNAQFALDKAEASGFNQTVFCTEELKFESMRRVRISESLYQSDMDSEFHLVYQPQLNLKVGSMSGVEALVRWDHPEMGRISPGLFIDIAEKNGFIVPLGKWILEKACTETKQLNESLAKPLKLAVNVSFIQIQQDDFVKDVLSVLEKTGFPPHLLEIELTERSLVSNRTADLDKIRELQGFGIQIAIDDFGTGYSSFDLLSKVDVNKIKIPREFIEGVDTKENSQRIVETIITMSRHFQITCLAEGIERTEENDFLHQYTCEEVQGYYYGKPVLLREIEEKLLIGAGEFVS